MTAALDDPESAEVIADPYPLYRELREHRPIHRVGDEYLVTWASANRDERAFERAEEFDVWRAPRRHLAFGYGLHFCIGAALARLEARVALDMLLDVDLAVDIGAAVRIPSSLFRGYEHLPVTVRSRSLR